MRWINSEEKMAKQENVSGSMCVEAEQLHRPRAERICIHNPAEKRSQQPPPPRARENEGIQPNRLFSRARRHQNQNRAQAHDEKTTKTAQNSQCIFSAHTRTTAATKSERRRANKHTTRGIWLQYIYIYIKLFVHIIHVILCLAVRCIAHTRLFTAHISFALVVLDAVFVSTATERTNKRPNKKLQQNGIKCYRILIIYQFPSVARELQHIRCDVKQQERERAKKNVIHAQKGNEQTNARATREHACTKRNSLSLSPVVVVVGGIGVSVQSNVCASCCALPCHMRSNRPQQRTGTKETKRDDDVAVYALAQTESDDENRENKHGFDGYRIRCRLSYWVGHRQRTDVRQTAFVCSYLICYFKQIIKIFEKIVLIFLSIQWMWMHWCVRCKRYGAECVLNNNK